MIIVCVKSSEENYGSISIRKRKKFRESFSMPNISNFATPCDFGIVFLALDSSSSIKNVTLQTVLVMINIVASLFGTLANGLIIMAYYRNRRLRTVQNTIFMHAPCHHRLWCDCFCPTNICDLDVEWFAWE